MNEDTDKKMNGKRLKVFNLPDKITEAELRQIFSNPKKNGGGPIQEMIIYSSMKERYAIITFEDIEAVETIVRRGNSVPVFDSNLRVEPFVQTDKNSLKFQPALTSNDAKELIKMKSVKEKNEEECLSLLSQLNLDDKCLQLHSQLQFDNELSQMCSLSKHSDSEAEPEDDLAHLVTEEKSKMLPLISNSEMVTANEHDVLKRTIKAEIIERHLSRMFYELYLDDLGLKDYDSDSMMLDGLHKNVYITFNNQADAEIFCQKHHDTDNCNITKATMATQDDFNTYSNRILLVGSKIPSSDRLKKLLKEKTGFEVKDIVPNQEQPCAVVIVFDEMNCLDITPLTWDLTNLNGLKMITAPVMKENALLVSGINGIKKILLERYMKSKKHSGGGPLKSVDIIDDNQALVVMLNETDSENLTLKDNHELEKNQLKVSVYHSCLQQNYLQNWISEQDLKELNKTKPADQLLPEFSNLANHLPSELSKSSKSTNPPIASKSKGPAEIMILEIHNSSEPADELSPEILESSESNKNHSQNKRTKSKKSFTEKEIQLKSEEFSLLEKSNIFRKLAQNQSDCKLILDSENCIVILRGVNDSSLANMEIEILKLCKSNIKSVSLSDLSNDEKKFLELINVRERLNSKLPLGYLKYSSGEIELFFMKSEDPKLLISLLKKQMFVKIKQLTPEYVSALQTIKGRLFLASIESNSNGNTFVYFDVDNRTLAVLGPEIETVHIDRAVDTFLDQKKFILEELEFPEGKMIFVSRHLKTEVMSLNSETETQLTSHKDHFIIAGLKEDVKECVFRLKKLRDTISRDFVTLKFDGISEFLKDSKGQAILKKIEAKNKCVIILNNEATTSMQDRFAFKRSTSQDSAEKSMGKREEKLKEDTKFSQVKVNFGNVELILEEGEINKQTTDVIVVTVDKSLNLEKRRISKSLLDEAGEEIQKELRSKHVIGIHPGEIAVTSGGRLHCKNIVYACLPPLKVPSNSPEYKTSLLNMKKMVLRIINEASHRGARTISIPSLGTGNLGYPANISASLIIDAVREFASENSDSILRRVHLIVYPSDKDTMKAFRTVVSSKGNDLRSPTDYKIEAVKKEKTWPFGNIKLVIQQGDITKESHCEAIVISIKDSMGLLVSGKVCKALWDASHYELQQECDKKVHQMKQHGVVMTSAPRLKCKKIIFISQDKFGNHWDDGILLVLMDADKAGIKTLAMPALGAGSRHADLKLIKRSIFTAVKKFSESQIKGLSLIKLVIFDKEMLEFFLESNQEIKSPVDDKQKEARPVTRKLSKDVVLDVYFEDSQNIAAAKFELEEICESNFKEIVFEDDYIHLLKKNNIAELKSFGVKCEIKISFVLYENKVIIKGFNHQGMQEVEMKLKELLNTLETEKEVKPKLKEPSIVWSYKKQDEWYKYEPLLNCDLEQEYKKNSSSHIISDMKGESYLIDFREMKQYTLDCHGKLSKQYCDIRRDCKLNKGQLKEEIDKKTDKKVPAAPLENEKGDQHLSYYPIFVWEYKVGQSWDCFEPWLNRRLEEECQKQNKFFIFTQPGDGTYEIDFAKMIIYPLSGMMTQFSEIRRSFIAKN